MLHYVSDRLHLATVKIYKNMAKQKKENKKITNLEEALAEIKQRFGEGAIMQLSSMRAVNVDVISTGAVSLDLALGVGGVPRGRIIEIFGGESSGKCVKSDTIIFSEFGMLPISSFGNFKIPEFQKKEIFVYSENCYEKTSHFYNGGAKNTIKIKTRYGYEIEGTPNHRIRVLDENGNYIFRRMDELQETDYVAIQRGQDCFGKGVDLSDFEEQVWQKEKSIMNTSKKDFKNFQITKEMARLMGYLVGGGTCANRGLTKNTIQITAGQKEVEEDIKLICQKLFGELPKITKDKRTKNTKAMRIYNAKARAFLHYAGLGWWKSGEKEVPWSILCSPKDIVANFLKALFECDGGPTKNGYTIEFTSKSEKLVRMIQAILLNFGIISKVLARYNKKYNRFYYHLYIDGQKDKKIFIKEIGFISNYKQEKLKHWLGNIKQFTTNCDVIPYLNKKLVDFLGEYRSKIKPTHRGDWDIFRDYMPCERGFSQLSYERLARILKYFSDGRNLSQYQEMENLYELGFFWDKIVAKAPSKAYVFDFTVPSNATFCGNGFVNHNTTMALHIVAETQKKGGTVAFVDAEHAMDPEYAGKIGVNMKDLLISQPDSGEQALQIVETLVMSGSVDLIVIDSVAALTPKAEIEGEIGDQHIGRQARLMSQALRKLTSVAANTNTTLIFLNQIRMKIGVFFGNPETTPGGLALKFYASVRVELRRIAQIKKGEQIIGSRIRAKIVKNKVAAPFRTAELDIYWNEGISKSIDLVNAGLRYDILKKVGAQLQYQDKKFGQSPDAARAFFEAEKKLATDLRKEIIEKAKEAIK